MAKILYEWCEVANKRSYTKEDAQYAVNLARKKHWKKTMAEIPKRYYYCSSCNLFHLTKQGATNDRREERERKMARQTNERRRIERMEEVIYRYRREY